jgi:hypothetical protein
VTTETERRLKRAEAAARQRQPAGAGEAAGLLADFSLSESWWERAYATVAAITGTTPLVVKDDVFRASREANEDRALNLLTSSQPPDALRAALADPIAWRDADEPTRHRMVKSEIVNRFVRETMEVVKAISQVPTDDFTAAELSLHFGPAYSDRLCGAIARTGAIVSSGEKRGSWSVYRDNPDFDAKGCIDAANTSTATHRETR